MRESRTSALRLSSLAGLIDLRESAHDGEDLAVLDHLPEMPLTESIGSRVHREELADRLEVGAREGFRVFRDRAIPSQALHSKPIRTNPLSYMACRGSSLSSEFHTWYDIRPFASRSNHARDCGDWGCLYPLFIHALKQRPARCSGHEGRPLAIHRCCYQM